MGPGFVARGQPVAAQLERRIQRLRFRLALEFLLETLQQALADAADSHGYPTTHGTAALREAEAEVKSAQIAITEAVKNPETREPFPGHLSVSERIANTCTDLGLICRPLGQSIVLCPPFILTDAQMDEMFDKLDAALTQVFDGLRAEGDA